MVVRVSADIRGVRELEAALWTAEGMLEPQVALAGTFTALLVAAVARGIAPKGEHQGGDQVMPLWTAIRAEGNKVGFGGERAPHGAVVNFGGRIPRHHSASKTRVPRQEHIYRAIGMESQRLRHAHEDAVFRALAPLF
jgi:hypothetical protein